MRHVIGASTFLIITVCNHCRVRKKKGGDPRDVKATRVALYMIMRFGGVARADWCEYVFRFVERAWHRVVLFYGRNSSRRAGSAYRGCRDSLSSFNPPDLPQHFKSLLSRSRVSWPVATHARSTHTRSRDSRPHEVYGVLKEERKRECTQFVVYYRRRFSISWPYQPLFRLFLSYFSNMNNINVSATYNQKKKMSDEYSMHEMKEIVSRYLIMVLNTKFLLS